MQHSRQTRITANIVGMMIFVQVILGGGSFILGWDVRYHLVWGTLTFMMLVVTAVLAARTFGTESTLLKVGLAAIVDFVVQGLLGLFSFQSGVPLVIHLTNGFLLAVVITYLISFADTADRATSLGSQPKIVPSGNMLA